jgi:LysM repeat protein
MTAVVLHRPTTPRTTGRTTGRSSGPSTRTAGPRRLRLVPTSPRRTSSAPRVSAPTVPTATTAPMPALRLTRRGRLTITVLLVLLGLAVSLLAGGVGQAGTTSQSVPVRYVTVAPGQSLWAVAGQVAPGADPRDTVAELIELNALSSSQVTAGQRIAVPIR